MWKDAAILRIIHNLLYSIYILFLINTAAMEIGGHSEGKWSDFNLEISAFFCSSFSKLIKNVSNRLVSISSVLLKGQDHPKTKHVLKNNKTVQFIDIYLYMLTKCSSLCALSSKNPMWHQFLMAFRFCILHFWISFRFNIAHNNKFQNLNKAFEAIQLFMTVWGDEL